VLGMEVIEGGTLLHVASGGRPGMSADTTALYPL